MDRKELKAFLAQAKKVKSKSYIYYDYVKFTANSIQFAGDNFNVKLTSECRFDECFVETKQLAKAVGVNKAKNVNVTTSKEAVTVDGISLPIFEPDNDFNVAWMLRPMLEATTLTLQGDFVNALAKCSLFTTNEKTRYELDNILVDVEKSIAVATDGKTLSVVPFVGEKTTQQIILPVTVARAIVELFDSTKPVTLSIEKTGEIVSDKSYKFACFKQDNLQVYCLLSSAKFPPYEKVVPRMENYLYSFVIYKRELQEVVDFLKNYAIKKEALGGRKVKLSNDVGILFEILGNRKLTNCIGVLAPIAIDLNFLSRLLAVCDKSLTIFTRSNITPLVATEGDSKFIVLPIISAECEE